MMAGAGDHPDAPQFNLSAMGLTPQQVLARGRPRRFRA
jgi:hypothetical protein